MKAPDKIYIQPNAHDRWFEGNMPNDNFVEYIRKDALMEWTSNMLGQVSDMGFDDGDVEHGYTRALQDVIDKLNSV